MAFEKTGQLFRSGTLSAMTRLRHLVSRDIILFQILFLCVLAFYQTTYLSSSMDHQVRQVTLESPCQCKNRTSTSKTQSFSTQNSVDIKHGFGGCLIIQDDNHLLQEWLAYHHHVLPLRRLIVGIDPRSRTSPTSILNRYRERELIEITEWHEEDMMPPHLLSAHKTVDDKDPEALKALYIERQIQFYTKCMAKLKSDGVAWATLTDTDEYILPNPHGKGLLPATTNMTVYEMLTNQENRGKTRMIQSGCVSMHRLQFGHKESNELLVENMVPRGFHGADFSTMRWRYHAAYTDKSVNKLAKCMVNLHRAKDSDFISESVNPHRPIKRLCGISSMYILHADSPFVAYHYSGSWEQWNYRNDFRPKRQRENFDLLNFDDERYQDDSIRPWLQGFVDSVGLDMASYLLEGVGKVETLVEKSASNF